MVEDIHPDGTPSINEDEPQPKRRSAKVSADTPDAMKVDPEALEVSDSGDWQLQVDVLQCIKGGITALFSEYLFLLVLLLDIRLPFLRGAWWEAHRPLRQFPMEETP